MKIYEVSQAKRNRIIEDSVDEASLSSLASSAKSFASGVKGAWDAGSLSNFKDSKRQAQIQQLADKSYKVWKEFVRRYADSITDPDDKKRYLSHTSNLYRNQLYAFVQKNFLGGRSLRKLDNGEHIASLINKLSAPLTPKPSSSAPSTKDEKVPGAPQSSSKPLKLGQTRTPATPEEIRARQQQHHQSPLDAQKAQAAAARAKSSQEIGNDRATKRPKTNESVMTEDEESNEKKLFTELISAVSMSQEMADMRHDRSQRVRDVYYDADSEDLMKDLSQSGITNEVQIR
jgi:hypothetical protein